MIAPETLPDRFKAPIEAYLRDGVEPDEGFLRAVLADSLFSATVYATEQDFLDLPGLMQWCHWNLPGLSWGDPCRIRRWCDHRKALRAASDKQPKTEAA